MDSPIALITNIAIDFDCRSKEICIIENYMLLVIELGNLHKTHLSSKFMNFIFVCKFFMKPQKNVVGEYNT